MKNKVTVTSGDWNIGDLAYGESKEITYTYKVADTDVTAGKVLNTATAKGKGPNNTELTATTKEVEVKTLGEPELSITKSATGAVKVGEDITYTITVGRSGTLSSNVTLVSATLDGQTVGFTSGSLTIASLAADDSAVLEIKATANAVGSVTNKAAVDSDETDPEESNEVETEVTGEPELTITKFATDEVKVGEDITYTITVENSGTAAATNVVITDTLSSNVTLVSATLDGRTVDFTSGSLTIASLAADDSAVLEIKATANAVGSVTNKAAVDSDETDPEESNEVETEVTGEPELTITKSATDEVKVGEDITYTITVSNSSTATADATNVAVYDNLDSSVELKGVTLNGVNVQYSFNAEANAIHVVVGTLAPGSKVELVITTTAKAAGTVTNKANASSTETGRKDSNVVMTTITEDIPGVPELTVTKSGSTAVKVGEDITYTIMVENTGTADATNVTVYDALNPNAELKNAALVGSGAIPTLNNNAVHVNIGTLAPGNRVELIITATAKAAGTVTNKANANSTETGSKDSNVVTTVVTEDIATEKINVTWVDGYNGDILKELPGVYDKGTTTIPDDQYPAAPAHVGYTFEQWTTQVLGNGDIIITANYRTLVVNPQGPTFEELTDLGITVEVVCDTNATHEPVTRSYPLMEGSYETFIADGSCTLVIYNDLYVEAYGGDHSLVGRPAQTIMLEYVGVPATIGDDETASDEIDDAASDATSKGENTDDVIDNNVDNDTDVTTPDAGVGTGNENGIITDSGEEDGNGDFAGEDGDGTEIGDDNGDADLPENGINNDEPIQLMSVEAISFSAPTVTGGWVIVQGTNTVTFHVRCEQPVARTHTVTWVNWNGVQLHQILNVAEGVVIPSSDYVGATPVHPADADYTYTFSGWSAPSEDAAGNVTYTALYDRIPIARTHTVTWLDWDGTLLYQIPDVADGTTIPSGNYVGATPTRLTDAYNTYTFSGWSNPSVDWDGNVTYVAQYTPYRIPEEGPVVPVTPPVTPVMPVAPTPGPTVIPDTPTPLDPGTTITDEQVPLAGAVGLNDVDHFAYIIGYDDDTVRPLNNITRAEVATIFFRLMTDDYRNANWSTSNSFSDVAAGSWYNNAISTCANAGALNGYADGSFKPNASITRAEFAAIAARFLSDEYTDDGTGDFSGTANYWAAKEIRLAAKAGWVRGDGNKFHPNDYITRAEVMTIVNRMLDRVPDADHMLDTMKKWIDNPEDAWYYEAVQEATNEHAYERDEMGVVETWTEILAARDWAALEKGWADANAQ